MVLSLEKILFVTFGHDIDAFQGLLLVPGCEFCNVLNKFLMFVCEAIPYLYC